MHAIVELGRSNRSAMHKADLRAQQLGLAGLGRGFHDHSLLFGRHALSARAQQNLLLPLEEINAALSTFSHGDRLRRCSYKNAPKVMQTLMLHINELMDGHRLSGYSDSKHTELPQKAAVEPLKE